MAEEVRFFLRVALYSAVVALAYWLVSGDPAGTVLLGAIAVAGAFLVTTLLAGTAPAPRPTGVRGHVTTRVNRIIGLAEDRDLVHRYPFAGGPQQIPSASLWPVAGGVAALLGGLGLVYGPWLLLPGIAVGIGAAIGWIAQETRRA